MDKRKEQLGMNPSTAFHRLRMDILFKFVEEAGYKCFRCNESLSRDTFSIEHKKPWLDSEAPLTLFFDLDNISFSHKSCNYSSGLRPSKRDLPEGFSSCFDCKEILTLDHFYKDIRRFNDVSYLCKKCKVNRYYGKTGKRRDAGEAKQARLESVAR